MEDELYACFDSLGIEFDSKSHPPVYTVEQAKELRGSIPGAQCKNLFLRDKKRHLFLVSCLEDRRFQLKSLREPLGARSGVSFASAELLRARLAIEPGAVTPFAVINDPNREIRVALDTGFRDEALLNFHPLRNDKTVSIRSPDLIRFLEKSGHPPIWIDFAELAAETGSGRD